MSLFLLGCGPKVAEEDDFIERKCEGYCDSLEPCEHHPTLSWDECFNSCTESSAWTESCREARGAKLDCLVALTCEEFEDRTERALAAEDISGLACYEESFEAALCR